MGSGSGVCGVVREVTPFLRADRALQQAADARSSGCIGVGGDAQVCARAGTRALASALAAMREDACVDAGVVADGDADEPPLTWPSQPDRNGRRRGQRGNGGDQGLGSRNRRYDGAAGYVSRCQRDGSWRPGSAAVLLPAATHAAGNSASQAPRQRVGDECRKRLMSMFS